MSLTIVPESKVAAVTVALQETFATTLIDSITPLTGGLSSALVYKIVVKAHQYVLRIMLHPNPLSDPARIFPIMQIAADAGVTPRLYYADVESAITITDFVDAKPLRSGFADSNRLLVELAHTVKRIHALPPFPPLVNFMDGVDSFIASFRASGRLPESATAEHFRLYAEIQRAYPRHDPDLVASHNDLNYGNILFDGEKLWLIDWEAAFLNDRYVDLANLANGFVTNAGEEDLYLRNYFGESLDDYKRARFFLMQQVCHFYYAMVMFNMLDARTPKGSIFDARMETPTYAAFRQMIGAREIQLGSDAGQLLFAKVVLNEALHNMHSPRFESALAQVTQ